MGFKSLGWGFSGLGILGFRLGLYGFLALGPGILGFRA